MDHGERFVFLEGDEEGRIEKQKQRVPVRNIMELEGLPVLDNPGIEAMSGRESVIEHLEPLRHKDSPNVIYGVPHAGEIIPAELYDKLTEEGRHTMPLIDVGTSFIFRSGKIGSVESRMSRYVVDPNRAPDFTPAGATVTGQPPGKILWKQGMDFGPMYKEGEEPTEEQIRGYAERFYLPYYNKMMAAIGTLADRRESAQDRMLVIDGHSFPVTENLKAYYEHYGIAAPEQLPMFILGDQEGKYCDPDIMTAFSEALVKNFNKLTEEDQDLIRQDFSGDIVGQNLYLKGVHNVKFWGAREQGVNAIQVECNESAYVNRPSGQWKDFSYNEKKMSVMRGIVERAALAVDKLLKIKKADPRTW